MNDATAGRHAGTAHDPDHHEYHSAVEVDESVDNWRDWVGPMLAILFVLAALVGLALTVGGYI